MSEQHERFLAYFLIFLFGGLMLRTKEGKWDPGQPSKIPISSFRGKSHAAEKRYTHHQIKSD